jgi:excisionase family DNA binding protein
MESVHVKTKLLSTKEAAEYLNVSTRTLWILTNQKLIPCVRIMRNLRYSISDLDSFIEANRQGAGR